MSRLGIAVLGGAVVTALALAYFVPGDRRAPSATTAGQTVAAIPVPPADPTAAQAAPAKPVAVVPPSAPAPPAQTAALPPPAATLPPVARIAPSFDVLRVTPKGDAVIAGRAAPGAEVSVLDGETVLGQVTADSRGEWVLLPGKPLPPGNRRLTLLARPPGGGDAVRSEGEVLLAVPEPNRDVAGQPSAQPSAPLAVLVPRDGEGAARALQVPGADTLARPGVPVAAGNRMLALDVVDYGKEGRLALSGRAEPGASLMLYLDDKPIGPAIAGPDGRWSATPPDAVAPGRYTLRVDEVRPSDGKVLTRLSLPFQRAAPPTDPGAGQFVVVQPGDNLWQIARQSYGAGPRYSVIFAANRTQIADPDLIYPGQIFQLPKSN